MTAPNAHDNYLSTQVLTATPQKLRLMLIEGAIRFALQTLKHWGDEKDEAAYESLTRCRGIITEMLVSIKDDQSELTRKVAALYVFLFQQLTEAQQQLRRDKIEHVISVLEVERETWRQLCQAMPDPPDPTLAEQNKPKEITARGMEAIPPAPHTSTAAFKSRQATGGFDSSTSQVPPAPIDVPAQQSEPGGFSLDA